MSAARSRVYFSAPPRCPPDATALDGLDAVILNGEELGARHRAQVRRAAGAARTREAKEQGFLSWLDGDDT